MACRIRNGKWSHNIEFNTRSFTPSIAQNWFFLLNVVVQREADKMRKWVRKGGWLAAALVLCAGPVVGQTKLRAWNIHPEGYPVTRCV